MSKYVTALLRDSTFDEAMAKIAHEPPAAMLKPLFSCLCSCDEQVKWYAVSAMGLVVAALAAGELEDARVVMRRFMWMLNDESGGIGWGVPEAMAEVMACLPEMAREFSHILVAFMREDGFYLELPALQRGLMWGLGRLAAASQESRALLTAREAPRYLRSYLTADDPLVRGLALRAKAILEDKEVGRNLGNQAGLTYYDNGRFIPLIPGS
ncbi:MAG: HEAT repeat domain-containing protein [Deltaproteobacteria bacterium]|nr:HEAT repeat domain-containing protein [Deltaproteobacteria bacterium]